MMDRTGSEFELLRIAHLFAGALDRCDFARAALYLAPDCRYQTGDEELVGPDAILASYRENADWAKHALGQVVYEHEAELDGGGVSVLYIDRILHKGQAHEYRCRQHLWCGEAGLVIRIVHEELPGERATLDAFFTQCGVRR